MTGHVPNTCPADDYSDRTGTYWFSIMLTNCVIKCFERFKITKLKISFEHSSVNIFIRLLVQISLLLQTLKFAKHYNHRVLSLTHMWHN